jgi:hypothetical protein
MLVAIVISDLIMFSSDCSLKVATAPLKGITAIDKIKRLLMNYERGCGVVRKSNFLVRNSVHRREDV